MTPAISRAIQFLADSQLPDGEFQTEVRRYREVTPSGEIIDDLVFDSSPFVTALVVYSLGFLRQADPRVPAMIDGGCRFLLSEMETGGMWRYWSSKNTLYPKDAIPPDLDDISCASYVLKKNGYQIPDNRGIVMESRDKEGRFYTWLHRPNSLRKLKLWLRTAGHAFSYSNVTWNYANKDDVCSVVNANVVHYLGRCPETAHSIDFLIQTVRSRNEESSIIFYLTKFSLYYMLSRAFFGGVEPLRYVSETVIDRILAERDADGSFGDELLTSQAVCSLLNFGFRDRRVLDKACEHIANTQRQNGSWRRVPMYGGAPTPDAFGSSEMTTAVCLEALFRCDFRS